MANSTESMEKAQEDIDIMYSKLDSVLTDWRDQQLRQVAEFKDETRNWEMDLLARDAKLNSMKDKDINIGTLIAKLAENNTDLLPNLNHKPKQSRYSLVESCGNLEDNMVAAIGSQPSNKRRKQNLNPCVKSKQKRQQQNPHQEAESEAEPSSVKSKQKQQQENPHPETEPEAESSTQGVDQE